MTKTKVNVAASETGQPTVILTGQALEQTYPESIKLTGILSAPGDFLERKYENYDPLLCHLEVNRLKGEITFLANPKEKHGGDVITGALTMSAIFKKFRINTGQTWTAYELATLFRENKFWFATPEEHADMLKNLNSFSAKVTMKLEQKQDNSGAAKHLFEREVSEIAWKREFRLNMPIFEGYDRKKFAVEIGVSPTDMNVKFFLESNEVYEVVETEKEALVKEQVVRFDDFGCSVVYLT